MSVTLAFVLAASAALAPNRDHTTLGNAIASRVDAEEPLFKGDVDRRRTAAYLVAIAFRESSLTLNIVGDHGRSFCAFQLHVSAGGTKAMLSDADACVGAAFVMLRISMRVCAAHPLAWYAEGGTNACSSARAQRISRDRLALAARLVRDIRVAETETLTPGPCPVSPSDRQILFLPTNTAQMRSGPGAGADHRIAVPHRTERNS